jgi:putative flippase GtrA
MVVIVWLLLYATLMFVLHMKLGMQYLIAQIIATLMVLCFNFLAHRSWTYKATSD